jgi:hypothetical protein
MPQNPNSTFPTAPTGTSDNRAATTGFVNSGRDSTQVSVTKFGAKGNGVTDDTAAFQSAITYAISNKARLVIPAGVFILTAQLTGSSATYFEIEGAGMGSAELRWTAGTGGIDIQFSTGTDYTIMRGCAIRDLALVTTQEDGGVALILRAASFNSVIPQTPLIENVWVAGYDQDNVFDYWTGGIKISNLNNTKISHCRYEGMYNNPGLSEYGIWLTDQTVNSTVEFFECEWADTAVLCDGTLEGALFTRCVMLGNNWSFYLAEANPNPNYITIADSHSDAFKGFVFGLGATFVFLHDNLVIRRGASTYTDIEITSDCDMWFIHDNMFVPGQSVTTGISITSDCYRIFIHDNFFWGRTTEISSAMTSPGALVAHHNVSENYFIVPETGNMDSSAVAALTLANGSNDNVDIQLKPSSFLRITGPTGAFNVTGFTCGANKDGTKFSLFNSTTQNMTITIDATSTAANRILTLTGADVALTGISIAHFIYSTDDVRWLLTGTQG